MLRTRTNETNIYRVQYTLYNLGVYYDVHIIAFEEFDTA